MPPSCKLIYNPINHSSNCHKSYLFELQTNSSLSNTTLSPQANANSPLGTGQPGQRSLAHGVQKLGSVLPPGPDAHRDLLHAPALRRLYGFPFGPLHHPRGPLGDPRQRRAAAGLTLRKKLAMARFGSCTSLMWWFPKSWGYHQILNFSGVFPYRPFILGYPHFRKTPCNVGLYNQK